MSVPEYSAGEWTAIVRPGFVALLGPAAAESTVRDLWQATGDGVFAALALLARDGFAGLPPFALVSVDKRRVHAALRGDVEVVVDLEGRLETLRSGEVSTWTERVLDGVGSVVVQVDAPADGPTLPVADGVVRASRVRIALAVSDEDVAAAQDVDPVPAQVVVPPTPTAEPEPLEPSADDVPASEPSFVEEPVALVPVEEPETAAADTDPLGLVPVRDEQTDATGVVAAAEAFLSDSAFDEKHGTGGPTVPLTGASLDDHDGLTILSTDLADIRDQLPSWASDDMPAPFRAPQGAPMPAKLVLSTGLVVPLDRAVLLGRAPQVARVSNRELPRLITVPSPQQDISRTHAEVRVEGDHVLVTDLDSTNGVHVARPGEGARRLHPGEPSVVGLDELVDLGDGVTFSLERGS
ncbi:FHA domain-containing protein [Cellulomonas sp. URHD0024]|uniref:FHA domain-containing protein n=1 Tax=Cellulomonas sp. URHD0024 TaxID=1302620 RepID=UPI00041E0E12|nr:FHA domain-containing protein [Cellulomonas sp. URHD0024]